MLKRAIIGVSFIGVIGCSGGSSSAPPPPVPPSISNLQYSPQNEAIATLGGPAPISVPWSFQYSANSSTISTWTLTTIDVAGHLNIATAPFPFPGASGTASGTISPDNSVAGTLNFSIYLTDNSGATSNTLNGIFNIVSGPSISTLWGSGSYAGYCGFTMVPIFTGGMGVISAYTTSGILISSTPINSGGSFGHVFAVLVNNTIVYIGKVTLVVTPISGSPVSYTQQVGPSGSPSLCGM